MTTTKDIGTQLVAHSKEADAFSAHRSAINELFPFIFEASKRMSLRAIGRWLQSEHQVSISPNTLARSMRNPEKFWMQILEELEPSVRIVARAHDVSASLILSSKELIKHLSTEPPALAVRDGESPAPLMEEYLKAVQAINDFWTGMPSGALTECLAYVGKVFEEDTAGVEHERRKDQ